ncbi:MAG TPA: FkbM family methyltransferase [Candidatus Binatia bacterium]|nr:FkbM family methyltransferase [Candidatus Binatia bacterium]
MSSIALIQATARLSDALFRRAPSLYEALYDRYKRWSDRTALAVVDALVRPGDRVADIGANVGFYAEVLAQRVGPTGRVYAFEPEARNYARLIRRTRAYGQVHPVRAAVTAQAGRALLHLSPDLNVDHRTYAVDAERASIPVEAVSLDAFLAGREQALEFIKMDIQGAEYDALVGMADVVARSPRLHILMELWPFVQDRFGAGTAALLSLLGSWGFEVRRLGAHGRPGARLTPEDALPERHDASAYFDVVCARPGT